MNGEKKRLMVSPLARRLAHRHHIDITTLKGSGPRGRIIQRDVQNRLQGVVSKIAPQSSNGQDPREFFQEGHYQEKKQDSLRMIIAQRLTKSAQSIPHYSLVMNIKVDALLAYLDKHEARLKMKLNHALIFVAIKALLATPQVNVTFCDDYILQHDDAHIGIAVATKGGIMTPIVHADSTTSAVDVKKNINDLISRARDRRLKPHEYQGGVMGVSNLGMFGVEQFSAIINPPQSSMLTLGEVTYTPKKEKGKNLEMVFVQSMKATLVCDHRVIDGAMGAMFLSSIRDLLSTPSSFLA